MFQHPVTWKLGNVELIRLLDSVRQITCCINCRGFLSVKTANCKGVGTKSKLAQLVRRVTSIREVLGSNLGWNIDYPDTGVSFVSSIPPGKYRNSVLNYRTTVRYLG